MNYVRELVHKQKQERQELNQKERQESKPEPNQHSIHKRPQNENTL